MVTVKALKNFYGTGLGSVSRGQIVEVSEISAKEMVSSGLAEYESGGPTAKDAPKPSNKMQPQSQSDTHAASVPKRK